MSLTSFISDKNFQELRDKFKTVFPRPQIQLAGEMFAPPLTDSHSVVGQAFDYILRFTLEHRHKLKIKSSDDWVADSSYLFIETMLKETDSKTIKIGYRRDIEKDCKEFLVMLNTEYSEAKQNHQKYILDGILTDSLIKSALFLARLDINYRVGIIDQNLGNENEMDIKDIRQLMAVLKDEYFQVDNHCIINPTFGDGSQLVQGADGDLIIDDTLIDIKVTKNNAVERIHLNQTIGYYILSLIGGVNDDKDFKPIKNIGLYFARHGVLWKISLSDLADEKTILKFKDWFIDYADKKLWGGRLEEIKKRYNEKKVEGKTKRPEKKKKITAKTKPEKKSKKIDKQ